MRKFAIFVMMGTSALVCSSSAFAAAPDGGGPWADSVVAVSQGLRTDGSAVLPAVSNPTAALGVAETTGAGMEHGYLPDNTYFSLGLGGAITLGFTNTGFNGPGPDIDLREVTFNNPPGYPDEFVDVYVSSTGETFDKIATKVANDALVSLPANITVFKFVRLVDVTPASVYGVKPNPPGNGYDLDAVKAVYGTGTAGTGPAHRPPSEPLRSASWPTRASHRARQMPQASRA